MAAVELDFVAVGANRASGCLSSSAAPRCEDDDPHMVAFGAGAFVALASLEDHRVVSTLKGHSGMVTGVAWIPRVDGSRETELTSTATDGTLRVWRRRAPSRYELAQTLAVKGEQVAATGVTATSFPDGSALIVTCTANGMVHVWRRGETDWALQQEIHAGRARGFNCVSLARLPPGRSRGTAASQGLVLLCGGLDNRLHVLAASSPEAPFAHALSLGGHQDWIRAISACSLMPGDGWVPSDDLPELLIATASQDQRIRLWRLCDASQLFASLGRGAAEAGRPAPSEAEAEMEAEAEETKGDGAADGLGMSAGVMADGEGEGGAEEEEEDDAVHTFTTATGGDRFGVASEALLLGHDDWVHWHPRLPTGSGDAQPLALLSCSMDRSVMIWCPEDGPWAAGADGCAGSGHAAQGVWLPFVRVGEITRGSVGFFGGCFGPRGDALLAHSYSGSLQVWRRHGGGGGGADGDGGQAHAGEVAGEDGGGRGAGRRSLLLGAGETWVPTPALSGCAAAVCDARWEPGGRYLVAASADQTTRVFTPWLGAPGQRPGAADDPCGRWCELARVQVHGHDMVTACVVPTAAMHPRRAWSCPAHTIVSGGDEKVIRVYQATEGFLQALQDVAGMAPCVDDEQAFPDLERSLTAYLPELGLSARVRCTPLGGGLVLTSVGGSQGLTQWQYDEVLRGSRKVEGGSTAPPVAPLRAPPSEERLASGTQWPEVDKLYGHGNELLCVAANPDGTLVASSCKARDEMHATIRLWTTRTWKQCAVLQGHSNSVVQLAFSHSGRYLASVSRDRRLCLFDVEAEAVLRASRALEDFAAGSGTGAGAGAGGDEDAAGDASKAALRMLDVVRAAPIVVVPRAHKRIIWSCSWSPDDRLLATGSRDNTAKVWLCAPEADGAGLRVLQASVIALPCAVTAVSFAPSLAAADSGEQLARYVLAVGLESGAVQLWTGDLVPAAGNPGAHVLRWEHCADVREEEGHTATVRRLDWRLVAGEAPAAQLLTCSTDHSLRVFSVSASVLGPQSAAAHGGAARV